MLIYDTNVNMLNFFFISTLWFYYQISILSNTQVIIIIVLIFAKLQVLNFF